MWGFPVARPPWMDVPSAEAPAFAGMTVVVHRTPWASRGKIWGGGLWRFPVAQPLWMDVPSADAPAFAGMTVVVHRTPWASRGRVLGSLGLFAQSRSLNPL